MAKHKTADVLMENMGRAQIPAYALPYLINGDSSGLTETDLAFIQEWESEQIEQFGTLFFDVRSEECYFTHFPEFGLPCDCYDVNIWGKASTSKNKS